MTGNKNFDVIIIGGSYAGLSAAMALGRSLRKVLIIDSGKPCNRQTPRSHNFITHDGEKPQDIARKAKEQVLKYETVQFIEALATGGSITQEGFEIEISNGDRFNARKLLFATGVADQMPAIEGFAQCWGISVLHCPYCHGYEVRNTNMGVLGNGDLGFELSRLIHHWSGQLTLFTNGKSTLTAEQTSKLQSHQIEIIETEIAALEHTNGYIDHIVFKNGNTNNISALFARVNFTQHCQIPEQLGCALNEQGYIKIDDFQRTSLPGVYAAGDNTIMFRSVAMAVAAGTKAGAVINKELIDEAF
ncbi:NAD(P)/FAD-dependent oxidoreductase [Rhodocytophaga rosea]|uniref:NAD(P)/FAD-dependent oxidoreductase n=1 Tax=Rhodocytophaga rosea TaxID=2704465 RepID=A0A6C0GLC7_9BACT|nr:NAD(P)/FAD-dependent oxidoreductase [Rhodocytophaga rosea]QHT68453.1 NAD(P)/FAD-dependent oxidoreductase [Rhodocytophaga rosea]